MGKRAVRTLRDAARFVDGVGLAFVFPDRAARLPSLWGAVCGDPRREMTEDDHGWTKQVALTWDFKDDLGARRLAWFGRFVRGKGTLVSLELLPALVALVGTDASGLSPLAREAYDRIGNVGAFSTLRLRESLRLHGSKGNAKFSKTMVELYRRLLIANVGTDDTETRWPSQVVDRTARAYPDAVRAAKKLTREKAMAIVRAKLPEVEPRMLAMITRRGVE
jgi:hypothetical protein